MQQGSGIRDDQLCQYHKMTSVGVTFLHRQQFGLGLGGVNVLYAHYKTLTSLCMESHLNHVVDGTGGSTAYLCRGGRSSS